MSTLKSQTLFDEFMTSYTPNFSQNVLEKIAEADCVMKEVKDMEEELQSEDITVRRAKELKKKIPELHEKAWKIRPRLAYHDQLKLDPSKIYEEMKRSVQEKMGILGRENTNDLGNLSLVLELLDGKTHAVRFIWAWEPLGNVADDIYKALLDEAGFDVQLARQKYEQLVKLRAVEKENEKKEGGNLFDRMDEMSAGRNRIR